MPNQYDDIKIVKKVEKQIYINNIKMSIFSHQSHFKR